MYAKRVCEGFEIKNLGEYHDLHLKIDALRLADIFQNLRKMCLKIYELDPAKFIWAPGLAWQAALKKTKVKLATDMRKSQRQIWDILQGVSSLEFYFTRKNLAGYDK